MKSVFSQVKYSRVTEANDCNIKSASSKVDENAKLLFIPKVNPSLTIAQLKEECKVRDNKVQGLSGKNKSWLLNFLVEGSEMESSIE